MHDAEKLPILCSDYYYNNKSIGLLSPDQLSSLLSEDGLTHTFGNTEYVYLGNREEGFIEDPNLNNEETSHALVNYFKDGRYYEDFFKDSRISIEYYIKEMQEWIVKYQGYLSEEDRKDAISYYDRIYSKYMKWNLN